MQHRDYLPRSRMSRLRGDLAGRKQAVALPVRFLLRLCNSGLAGVCCWLLAMAPGLAQKAGPSGYPVPRFVSLKSDPVNLRKGPGTEYPKAWIFRRAGLPVEVIQEYGNWRRVRDSGGATGWVLYSLLSGRRTVLILPWETKKGAGAPLTDLRSAPRASSGAVARLEAGTLAVIKSCTQGWCYISVGDYRGYVQKHAVWGVYTNEVVR